MTHYHSNTSDDRFVWAYQLLIDSLLLAAFLLAAVPETLLPPSAISGLQFCMWPYFAAAALLMFRWFCSWTNLSLPLLGLMLGGLWMAVVGFWSLKDALANKSFAGDLIMYSGVICGFIWAAKFEVVALIRRLRIWAVLTLVFTFSTIIGLQIGVVSSLGGDNRIFVYSLYWGSWLLTCLGPIIVATADIECGGGLLLVPAGIWRTLGFACLVCAFLVGFISATRSVVIGVVASLLAIVFLERKRLHPAVKILIGIFGMIGLIYLGSNMVSWFTGSELSARFQSKDVSEETRFVELGEMWDAMEEKNNAGPFWHGLGFGSVFYSTGVNTPAYVINPHVAVLTLLFKGGVPVFVLCTVLPCALCVVRLLRRASGPIQRAACAGGLLYFVLASLSGGWDFKNLFLFGTCYAMAFGKTRSEVLITSTCGVEDSQGDTSPLLAEKSSA